MMRLFYLKWMRSLEDVVVPFSKKWEKYKQLIGKVFCYNTWKLKIQEVERNSHSAQKKQIFISDWEEMVCMDTSYYCINPLPIQCAVWKASNFMHELFCSYTIETQTSLDIPPLTRFLFFLCLLEKILQLWHFS